MPLVQRFGRIVELAALCLLFSACAGQREPAQRLIADIDSTVNAAAGEAAKYVPDQLADVQSKLGALKASYDKKDYAAVVTAGPPVLSAAQTLATAAAAKKDEVLKALNDQWSSLSSVLPADVTALQNRIELLGKKSGKKMAAGIDVAAAQSALAEATGLWSKAQAAFASGNLDEAVSTAKEVKTRVETLAGSLKVDLPPAAT